MRLISTLLFTMFLAASSLAQVVLDSAPLTEDLIIREGLTISNTGRSGRWPIHTDTILHAHATGSWQIPEATMTLTNHEGEEIEWRAIEANEDGAFPGRDLRRGYLHVTIETPRERMLILKARGHGFFMINGAPRGGNPYGYDYFHVPIHLQAGSNELLVKHSRGSLRLSLAEPRNDVYLHTGDMTLPDIRSHELETQVGGIIVINAQDEAVTEYAIETTIGSRSERSEAFSILPGTVRKVPFRIPAPDAPEGESISATVSLLSGDDVVDEIDITLGVRSPGQTYRKTFISEIDGSVQYYAVNPQNRLPGDEAPGALFLSLHGASVEAMNQANAYSSKTWGTLVAPTNRRPFGFDWEDWGRLDAIEVLELATKRYQPDASRVYLTGHSMGGHGTWQVGAHFPDRFAAIAPSAGWISFMSYTGAPEDENPDPVMDILLRARNRSDTLALKHNYKRQGIYIIHGDADNNVPVDQARQMMEELEPFHRDIMIHEEPGQGHWWDISDEPGADCVDWAPMFDFFARHAIPHPTMVRDIDFTTVNPAISSRHTWVEVLLQEEMLRLSRIQVRIDPGMKRFVGSTENIQRLRLHTMMIPDAERVDVQLDEQTLTVAPSANHTILLQKTDGTWETLDAVNTAEKGPHRYGPFKEAFQHNMVFVVGTAGNEAETTWAMNKARSDAETWWYRGNGSVDIVPDTDLADALAAGNRNVILYGNADTNSAWDTLLGDAPIRVSSGAVQLGETTLSGDDYACVFAYPMKDSESNMVAVVSGSGLPGMHTTNQLPYFISGAGFPDYLVLTPESLLEGTDSVEYAGFFTAGWELP